MLKCNKPHLGIDLGVRLATFDLVCLASLNASTGELRIQRRIERAPQMSRSARRNEHIHSDLSPQRRNNLNYVSRSRCSNKAPNNFHTKTSACFTLKTCATHCVPEQVNGHCSYAVTQRPLIHRDAMRDAPSVKQALTKTQRTLCVNLETNQVVCSLTHSSSPWKRRRNIRENR